MEEKNIQEQTEKMTQEAQDLKRALQEIEELKQVVRSQGERIAEQDKRITEQDERIIEQDEQIGILQNGYKTLSEKISETFKRLGQWVTEKIDFAKEVMKEDIEKGLDFMDVLKTNFHDLTDRASETTKNLFDNVSSFFQNKVPAPFNKVLDFMIARYDAEMDAHFLDVDTKTLNAMEKVAFIIAVEKGKIQDNQAEWVSTLKHEGWKLAEKLGFHQERNKELGNKLLESTKLFGEAIKGIGEVCKEIPQPAVNWIKTNLIDTIPKSVEKIQNAVNTSKDYVKKAFTLSVPEFFKAAKEGVERAIAEKEGYKMMANGEMVAPTLGEVVKNKLAEPFAPIVDKIKSITQKSNVIIKKEGAYATLGESTKNLKDRGSVLSLDDLPASIEVREPNKEQVDLVNAKAEKVENALSKANETIHFGGHLSEGTLQDIKVQMNDLTETIDTAIGKDAVKELENVVKEEQIVLAVSNDLGLKPAEMVNTEPCEQYLLEKVTVPNEKDLKDATIEFSYFYSEKEDTYLVKEDITTKNGECISILYDTKDLDNPVRINEQKEIGGESRTVFDKSTGFIALSAINNGIAGKVLDAMPEVKKAIETVKEIAEPAKNAAREAAKDIIHPER